MSRMTRMNSRTNDNRCRLARKEAQMLDSVQTTGVMVMVEIVYAVIVQCVGIWFLYAYSRVCFLHHSVDGEAFYLTAFQRFCLEKWEVFLMSPILTSVLAVFAVRMRCANGVRFLCRTSWLCALILVCVTIVAWEYAHLHVVRFGD